MMSLARGPTIYDPTTAEDRAAENVSTAAAGPHGQYENK